jgi:hypothetical protein
MNEKTGRDDLINRILDHPANNARDQGELRQIRQKLNEMTFGELQTEYRRIQ